MEGNLIWLLAMIVIFGAILVGMWRTEGPTL